MSALASYLAYRQLSRSQWLSREDIRRLQDKKLRRLIVHAYQSVPFYKKHFDAAGVEPNDIQTQEDLYKLPPVSKADLIAAGQKQIISSIYRPNQLTSEHTSGSTGQPFTVSFDADFLRLRNGLFLRTLAAAGYRIGQKLMLITGATNKQSRPWLRWRYASIEDPVDKILEELNNFQPDVLYGCMTPLRQLAQHILQTGSSIYRPRIVVSTAEVLDPITRRLFEEVYQADVYDTYGLTEMGMMAWECPNHNGYHLSEDTAIIEFVREKNENASRMVMTNLDLLAMPLIRFQTGDFATHKDRDLCGCGRSLQLIERVEGRILDSIKLANGQMLSPYRFTLAIETIPNIKRYQLIQEDVNNFLFRIEGNNDDNEQLEKVIHQTISAIVGDNVRVRVSNEPSLDPKPGKKFRVVESRLK